MFCILWHVECRCVPINDPFLEVYGMVFEHGFEYFHTSLHDWSIDKHQNTVFSKDISNDRLKFSRMLCVAMLDK